MDSKWFVFKSTPAFGEFSALFAFAKRYCHVASIRLDGTGYSRDLHNTLKRLFIRSEIPKDAATKQFKELAEKTGIPLPINFDQSAFKAGRYLYRFNEDFLRAFREKLKSCENDWLVFRAEHKLNSEAANFPYDFELYRRPKALGDPWFIWTQHEHQGGLKLTSKERNDLEKYLPNIAKKITNKPDFEVWF